MKLPGDVLDDAGVPEDASREECEAVLDAAYGGSGNDALRDRIDSAVAILNDLRLTPVQARDRAERALRPDEASRLSVPESNTALRARVKVLESELEHEQYAGMDDEEHYQVEIRNAKTRADELANALEKALDKWNPLPNTPAYREKLELKVVLDRCRKNA